MAISEAATPRTCSALTLELGAHIAFAPRHHGAMILGWVVCSKGNGTQPVLARLRSSGWLHKASHAAPPQTECKQATPCPSSYPQMKQVEAKCDCNLLTMSQGAKVQTPKIPCPHWSVDESADGLIWLHLYVSMAHNSASHCFSPST